MAVIYYPTGTTITRQDTSNPTYTQLFLTNQPNTIMVFDSGSNLSVLSASLFYLTASNCISASYALNGGGSGISASYALTASYALNGGTGGTNITASYVTASRVMVQDGDLYLLGTLGTWFKVVVDEFETGSGVIGLA